MTESIYTRYFQFPCERGFSCIKGVRKTCAAGRYGSSLRNSEEQCSGVCDAGFYCPEGSTSPQMFPCGAADRFCPGASVAPTFVQDGFYSQEGVSELIRSFELPCPPGYYCVAAKRFPCAPGRFGRAERMTDPLCSGPCKAGYYCPEEATTVPDPLPCGNSTVYCQTGSFEPSPVLPGYYTVHTGLYQGRLQLNDPLNHTMSAMMLCEPGHWCSDGIKHQCPAGRFGWSYGTSSSLCDGVCAPGTTDFSPSPNISLARSS